MSTTIKQLCSAWLDKHPGAKQWLWFIALWTGGLVAAVTLTYPIKLLIKFMS